MAINLNKRISTQELKSGKTVVLAGWAQDVKFLGKLAFIILRDREGLAQLVATKEFKDLKKIKSISRESVLAIEGEVKDSKSRAFKKEIKITKLEVLNKANPLPMELAEGAAEEETRLKYRFLDLRKLRMKNNMILRHKIIKAIRDYFDKQGFLEIETPCIAKSTPEGARDFLIPSRVQKGKFYALPQSPQIFKQLLMVAGMEKYFQIARCFRDEDMRSDRQIEFTQLDVELSFADEEMVYKCTEESVANVFKEAMDVKIKTPLPQMKYEEAMRRFGSDKPDIRFGYELQPASAIEPAIKEKRVKAIVVDKQLSEADLHELAATAQTYKAKGLYVLKGSKLQVYKRLGKPSEIKVSSASISKLRKSLKAKEKDLILLASEEEYSRGSTPLGQVRITLAKQLKLIKPGVWKLLWVTEFPMFEWKEEEKRWVASHHPFTQPNPEHVKYMKTMPEKVLSRAYDLVLNGTELGGGSIRIHNAELQSKVFDALKISKKDAERKFGFLLNAFKYGAPPHGGIALGLDRFVALLAGEDSIREVMAFPKNKAAEDPMMASPDEVSKDALWELGIAKLPK